MSPGEVKAIRTTEIMVITIENFISPTKLLIRVAAYDTVQQRKILPLQETKAAEMAMRKRRMVRMPKRDGEGECMIIKHESSSDIYVTALVEAE